MWRLGAALPLLVALGCTPTTMVAQGNDDTCRACHGNISVPHGKAVISCVQCHGGNNTPLTPDQLATAGQPTVPPRAANDPYQMLLDTAHVHPERAKTQFYLGANGVTDSPSACYGKGVDKNCEGPVPQGTIDDAIDSELNRDINYLRFINPGDLRVAHASCGAGAGASCHADEVARVRRSMMATNASVVTAAYIGNFARLGTAADHGIEPHGYVFPLDDPARGPDHCFNQNAQAPNTYDPNCLASTFSIDSHDVIDTQGASHDGIDPSQFLPNINASSLEIFPGVLVRDPRLAAAPGKTAAHTGFPLPAGGTTARLPWGGLNIDPASEPHQSMFPPDNLALLDAFDLDGNAVSDIASSLCQVPGPLVDTDPVSGVLRGFRAYYPLWLPGTSKNFDAVAGSTLDGTVKAFNPYGRGHSSGCTGCHMIYNNDGINHDSDPAIQSANRSPTTALTNGCNVAGGGLCGMDVLQESPSNVQQRFYPAQHQLTTRIPARQCGLCHTFVTRIDLAYQGMFEVEEGDLLSRNGNVSLSFNTPAGTPVQIFDALEFVNFGKQGGMVPTSTTNAQNLAAGIQSLQDNCPPAPAGTTFCCSNPTVGQSGSDACAALGIYSNDLNNNGEFDPGETLPTGIDGTLFLPDRIPRKQSVDGRQARLVYGGANGTTHLSDVHLERGMQCIDCHFYQDMHGDGNLYTNNWDAIEIECEDCHGSPGVRAQDLNPGQLLTSGPNGRNDLLKGMSLEGKPFFEVQPTTAADGSQSSQLLQRSRLDPNLSWVVPQMTDAGSDPNTPLAALAHTADHVPMPGASGKLECYSCHNAFTPNCLSCHYQQDYLNQTGLAAPQQDVFVNGFQQSSHTDFQLFGMVRAPLILAQSSNVEKNRLSPFRSSMEAIVSIADCNGDTFAGNLVRSNCRSGKPTSGVGMNNFMPHTVRSGPGGARGCETCHPAYNGKSQVNNHLLAQTYGLGTGRLNWVGDWLMVGDSNGLDLVDIKKEGELPGHPTAGSKNSFPGFVIDSSNQRTFPLPNPNNVNFNALDVALLRGFDPNVCTGGGGFPFAKNLLPLPHDFALIAAGTTGLVVAEVTTPDTLVARAQQGVLAPAAPFVIPVPNNGSANGVDIASPDLSDTLVYVAGGSAGLVRFDLSGANFSSNSPGTTFQTTGGANGVKLFGTRALVATDAGLEVVDLVAGKTIGNPLAFSGGNQCSARRITTQGFVAYVATDCGLFSVDVSPAAFSSGGPALLGTLSSSAALDVALSGHIAFALFTGDPNLHAFDITEPSRPDEVTLPALQLDNPGQPLSNPTSIVIGAVPTETWAFVADDVGVRAINVSVLFDPYQGRSGYQSLAASPALKSPQHLALTIESRDPLSPRDPANAPFQTLTFAAGSGGHIARGLALDRIGDESGRRLRDSWNPGTNAIGADLMTGMLSSQVVWDGTNPAHPKKARR